MPPEPLTIWSPAKINLALAVGPCDPSDPAQRHPICSWMVGITLYDELTITPLEPDRFSRYAIIWHKEAIRPTDINWPITNDLAVRAHLLLEEHTGQKMPIQLKLEKRIPVGAGLGGGSSNAAAMLRACNTLFNLDLSITTLTTLAEKLGSDIPFFLDNNPALVTGFGEKLQPIENNAAPAHFVLIFPEFGCNTPSVYHAFDTLAQSAGMTEADLMQRFTESTTRITEWVQTGITTITEPMNHLSFPAFHTTPDLRRLWGEIVDLVEIPVHLTGSGSTLFIICDSEIHAQFTAKAVNERIAGVSAIPVCSHDSKNF